ncbi:MAG: class I SAM-dependent methyltransferase [Candidatus Woesearchaeota archaeon]
MPVMPAKDVKHDSISNYYDCISKGYDALHGEEQIKKLELIGKEINNDDTIKDFIKPSYKLLDVGCGSGISTGFFNVRERKGIDPSVKLIDIAKKNYPTCEFKIGSAENLPYTDNQFDIVISLTAIQNFEDIEKGLEEIKRTGKKYYIITFLKKTQKQDSINHAITKRFQIIKKIEEDKDVIYFCKK